MTPLTDHERESLVPALELCDKLNIETGWHMTYGIWSIERSVDGCVVDILADEATRYDLRSIEAAIAEWLEDHETVSSVSTANLNGRKHRVLLSRESVERGIYEEADCKLAALTAAAKGVGK